MDNYYIENKETRKIELHFEKSAYMALTRKKRSNQISYLVAIQARG